MPRLRHQITSVVEYISKISEIKKNIKDTGNNSELLFRGQCVDEPLLPRLARLNLRIKENSLKKTEELILSEFERGILPLAEFKHGNNWDLVALAQHHGLPTRLLDWTYSSLAALWFCIEDCPKKDVETGKFKNGVVWVLESIVDDFDIDIKNTDPLTNQVTKIFRSNVISRRISAQAGLFTIHFVKKDGKITPFETHGRFKNRLSKITIPFTHFAKLRKELSLLGINHSTLFPDIDGLAKHLEWRFSKYTDED